MRSFRPIETTHISHFASLYWFWWSIAAVGLFAAYEGISLVTGHPENTLSNWVWENLHIKAGESISQWSAGDLLTFAAYITIFVVWLPWHFWFGKFR